MSRKTVIVGLIGIVGCLAGCETYIEYGLAPVAMKSVVDACVAAGGEAHGPIVDATRSTKRLKYHVTCWWSSK